MSKSIRRQPPKREKLSARRSPWWLFILSIVASALTAGHFLGLGRVQAIDEHLRNDMLEEAVFVARTLNPELVKALSFTDADSGRVEFEILRDQLRSYQTVSEYRGIYTLGLVDDELRFGPESYAADDDQSSEPGTIYLEPGAEDYAVFENGTPYVGGPYSDEYGSFLSALAPVIDPRTGEVLAVEGIDMEASLWRSALDGELLISQMPVAILSVLFLVGLYFLWRRQRTPAERQGALRLVEPAGVAIIGLALSIILAMSSYREEEASRAELFRQLAESKAQIVVNAFNNLQELRLGALEQFFESSDDVSREEFREFTEPMLRRAAIRAMAWILPIENEEIPALEQAAADEGFADFIVWDLEQGSKERVSPRDVHYVAWYIEPIEENESGLGYDIASEPLRRTAVERAMQSGFATASDAINLVANAGEDVSLGIFMPVYRTGSSELLGITAIAVQIDEFLRSLLSFYDPSDDSSLVELYQLSPSGAVRFLASSNPEHSEAQLTTDAGDLDHDAASAVFPVMAVGKTYAIVISPDEAFLSSYPLNSWWITLTIGMFITVLMTMFAFVLTRRRQSLETQVRQRTADLLAAYDATIEGWSKALELRDKETEGHTQRVTALTVRLAQHMGLDEEQIVHIRRGALLHDIGKLGVPDRILHKARSLTPAELKQVKNHPEFAYNMLSDIAYLRPALDIPLNHHERWDGKGYPRGLKGARIPMAARLFAIVDVYDALTSDRPYRRAWTHKRAIEYILAERGRHFDPAVVDGFIEMLG